MKNLNSDEANEYLKGIGMRIGDWNEITYPKNDSYKIETINYQAPRSAAELLCFSQHVAGWLPRGDWKIFQIDNSTGWMDPVELSLFGGLLVGGENFIDFNRALNNTLLFEFGKSVTDDENTELLIVNLIFVFLLFELHGYVVSSNSPDGQLLGVQDGFIYFMSGEKSLFEAENIIKNYEACSTTSPEWVQKILTSRQEEILRGNA